ncbi:TIGR02281 family clan AA aspartic protease [Gammaproteobacteria bacterium]|nr:TIGR02281 family clan AA aspartic protease [Gammaproteobacteria bacterium]
MRKLGVGLLIFMAGWGLSWFTYNYPDKTPLHSAEPVINTPSKTANPERSATELTSTEYAQVDDISSLLQREEFEAVVARYESLQFQLDDKAAADARSKILSYASQLVAESRFGLAEQLLQRFLIATFRDVEARMLLARVYLGELNLAAAIDQLYEARGHAYQPIMLQRVTSRIRSTVAERAASLKGNNDPQALLALYQQLTQLEPDYAPWFIELAVSQLLLEDKDAARRSLLLVLQDPDVGAQAQDMLAELTRVVAGIDDTRPRGSAPGVVGIALHRRGNHFIVDASPAHNRNIQLLIDTGASLTMLNSDVFKHLGSQYTDSGRTGVFNTANGRVRAPIYILNSLVVGDWQVNQLEVGVLSGLGGSNFDGLLGMNFLKHFQFFIDQDEAVLRLAIN